MNKQRLARLEKITYERSLAQALEITTRYGAACGLHLTPDECRLVLDRFRILIDAEGAANLADFYKPGGPAELSAAVDKLRDPDLMGLFHQMVEAVERLRAISA